VYDDVRKNCAASRVGSVYLTWVGKHLETNAESIVFAVNAPSLEAKLEKFGELVSWAAFVDADLKQVRVLLKEITEDG
jgi:hypothetical protein